MRWLAISAVVVLYVLHQDFWLWTTARPLVLGFLPAGLTYHIAYMLVSAVLFAMLVKFFWPSDLEK
jgi:hypothetical protein